MPDTLTIRTPTLEIAYEAWAAQGTPAYVSGDFETFLQTNNFLHSVSSKYNVTSTGTVSAQSGGGCEVAPTT